ncbi:LptA/OstA family protein [Desulfonatronospira sp.]|uniref:LptA/OstA family protein n=1 Tax=Desulfonatronospira sp. TaxID=1962951 RepID=UPI0025BC383D|nr:LptA/OstA family protein [Desulfonatronospira sp.]
MFKKRFTILLLPAVLFLLCIPVHARNNACTEITSTDMTFKGRENLVVFSGDVYVLRHDFELWSDELYVYLKHGTEINESSVEGDHENIEKIVARGQVRIQGDGREGRSGLLTYHPDTEVVEMEQDPMLIEGRNTIEGEKIVLNLKDHTSQVFGSDAKRVRVIFHPDEDEQ